MKNIITILSILTLSACNKTIKKEKVQPEKVNSTFNTVLEKQIMAGAASEYGSFDHYDKKDLDALVEIEATYLQQNGFKNISNEDFIKKIEEIFNRKIDPASTTAYLKISPNDKCDKDLNFKPFTADNQYIYISKKYNLITYFYPLPTIIDYKTLYPKLTVLENIPIEIEVEGEKINAARWKDIPDLQQIRNDNLQILTARNKYLFNDSKADLAWLKSNDKQFLETLVKNFGYVKDKDLVNFILQNNYNNTDEFEKVLFNVRCNGDIIFNKEVIDVIDVIAHLSSGDKTKYLNSISDLIIKETKDNNSLIFSDKSFEKKAEMLGKLAYYSTKITESSNIYYIFFSTLNGNLEGKNYETEFKKNNYYNIQDFKKIWEETKTGGISYPGME
ncbi:hypothetical protein SAMN05421786_105164 [Chryseobacterium ureilyticum]|uniref:Uncharacterized protein n=1 Tax=Chryseobacterium ureilyticum TaxID=373668 RepID=A0A1N7PGJ0_9FLAO|nr:hypothetical protein [Chryseobacterium ureilyticum]SIT09755.1 hypothetical protein SAMN05421786_105164 [Chryseobacterium ureilyticum]